jgi:hypothetical protein
MKPIQAEAKTKKKQAYEPPKLRIVKIAEGQQVLGVGCKLMSGGTARGVTPCYPGNACAQPGS